MFEVYSEFTAIASAATVASDIAFARNTLEKPKFLEARSGHTMVWYDKFGTPSGYEDRDRVYMTVRHEIEETGEMVICCTDAEHESCPMNADGIKRAFCTEGYKIEPLGMDKCKVRRYVSGNLKLHITRQAMGTHLTKTFGESMTHLAEMYLSKREKARVQDILKAREEMADVQWRSNMDPYTEEEEEMIERSMNWLDSIETNGGVDNWVDVEGNFDPLFVMKRKSVDVTKIFRKKRATMAKKMVEAQINPDGEHVHHEVSAPRASRSRRCSSNTQLPPHPPSHLQFALATRRPQRNVRATDPDSMLDDAESVFPNSDSSVGGTTDRSHRGTGTERSHRDTGGSERGYHNTFAARMFNMVGMDNTATSGSYPDDGTTGSAWDTTGRSHESITARSSHNPDGRGHNPSGGRWIFPVLSAISKLNEEKEEDTAVAKVASKFGITCVYRLLFGHPNEAAVDEHMVDAIVQNNVLRTERTIKKAIDKDGRSGFREVGFSAGGDEILSGGSPKGGSAALSVSDMNAAKAEGEDNPADLAALPEIGNGAAPEGMAGQVSQLGMLVDARKRPGMKERAASR